MDSLQARLDTFTKGKKTKSSGKPIKWPHSGTHLATPDSLSEAGFYYNPTSEYRDNVVCFMCGKELSDWDAEDNPFDIHWAKCKTTCAWAAVRCGLKEDLDKSGNYEFSDSTRVPSSKAMEKARLETFTFNKSWPHDSVKGHGASSKKMAKAGFVYTPQSSGDDTATCFYCSLALSGWDAEDDPTQEHRKRVKKASPCPFFTATVRSLGKSTSKPPSKQLPRAKASDDQVIVLDSDDELASAPASGGTAKTRKSTRTADAKTPASRRSTRGAGSRTGTTGSEVEDTDGASGSETGKRVSKSKRKGARRITVIEEEMEVPEAPVEEVVVVKPKRGRLPKASKAKQEPQPESALDETDFEPPAPPPPKKAHTRTRSKANVESESEAPRAGSSKPTHSRMKSASKVTPTPDETQPAPKGSKPNARKTGHNSELPSEAARARAAKSRDRAISKTASKRVVVSDDDRQMVDDSELEDLPLLANGSKPRVQTVEMEDLAEGRPKRGKSRQLSVSGDATHGTVQPAPLDGRDHEVVDVDKAPPIVKLMQSSKALKPTLQPSSSSHSVKAAQKMPSDRVDSGVYVDVSRPPSRLAESTSSRSSSREPPRSSVLGGKGNSVLLSRTSSMSGSHSLNGRAGRETLKVVEVSSDDEMDIVPPSRHVSEDGRMSVESTVDPQGDTIVTPAISKAPEVDMAMAEAEARLDESIHNSQEPHARAPDVILGGAMPGRNDPSRHQASAPPIPSTPPQPHRALSPIPQSPSRDASTGLEEDAPDDLFTPFMSLLPIQKLKSITDEEELMTIEQYVRKEIEIQYQQFKADGERRIEEFRKKAAEARNVIEAS